MHEFFLVFGACYCLVVVSVVWVLQRRRMLDFLWWLAAFGGVYLMHIFLWLYRFSSSHVASDLAEVGFVALLPVACFWGLSRPSGRSKVSSIAPKGGVRLSVLMVGLMLLFRLCWIPADFSLCWELPRIFRVLALSHALRGLILLLVVHHARFEEPTRAWALPVFVLAVVDGGVAWVTLPRGWTHSLGLAQVPSAVVVLAYAVRLLRRRAPEEEPPVRAF